VSSEHQVVSVLLCTLANVATLGQRLEAEALHQQMQRFFALILEEVERYGGTLQRMLDDGTLGLFGAPVAYEDRAPRAVLAALGLQQRLRVSRSDLAVPPGEMFAVQWHGASQSGLVPQSAAAGTGLPTSYVA
jgi:adenylate cyclase